MTGLHAETPASAIHYANLEEDNWLHGTTQRFLIDDGDRITEGMAKRVANYARKRLEAAGFGSILDRGTLHVSGQCSYSDAQKDLTYQVEFHMPEGGIIGVQGILTDKGWPCIDHGFFCTEE